jgi:hypothetical protein
MPVEFVVHTADLRQATDQLKANREEFPARRLRPMRSPAVPLLNLS